LVNPGTPQAWEITLRPGVNRIGCSAESDFTINHPSISPKHCDLLVSDTGVMLKDLGSKGGTFVDGAPVREIWLQTGQHIQLGAIDAIFESRQTASTATSVNQPAPGATIIVADFGSLSTNQPNAPRSEALVGQPESGVVSPAPLPASSSAEPVGHPKKFPVHLATEREGVRRKQFILGVTGAIVGSLVGVFVWFLLIKSTGTPLLVMAWGVGGLAGLGALRFTKRGGPPLGAATAICALVAIIGGESLAAKAIRDQETITRAVAAYRSQLEFAKEALRAESPGDFRKLLAKVNEMNSEEITEEQIKRFQEEELPTLRNFALGKPSKAEFSAELRSRLEQEFNPRDYYLKENPKSGLFLILFAALGLVTAYKLGSGRSDQD
jgi:hypothetical protein